VAVVGLLLSLSLLLLPTVSQASKVKVASIGGAPGGGLGQFSNANSPRGIAVNNSTGNVYVADFNNRRIDEFTSSGTPIRAWGNNVVASGQDFLPAANAVQSLTVTATGGKYKLKFSGSETAELEFNSTAGQIQTALTGLSSIGSGNVTVTGTGPYTITFGGALQKSPEPAITVESGPVSPLTGGTATISVTNPGATGFEICNATSTPQDVCQAGTATGAAGGLNGPTGVAIDQSTGNVYVTEQNNRRVSEYTASGAWIASWGLDVVKLGQDNAGTGFEVCKASSNPVDICQEAPENPEKFSTAGAGSLANSFQSGIAVEPSAPHNIYVADQGNNRVQVFSPSGAFLKTFGADVVTDGATGTGTLTNGSPMVSGVTTTSRVFQVGQAISSSGGHIPPGTTITEIKAGEIKLSQAATGSGTETITAPEGAGNLPSNEKQTVSLGGSPTGGSFTLSYTTPNPSPTTAVANTTASLPFNDSAADLEAKLASLSNIGAGNVAVSGPNGGPWTVEFTGTRFANTDVTQMTANASGLTPSGTVTITSQNALETCTVAADCRTGASGNAVGQFGAATGASRLAVDASGNVFVVDFVNQRIEKFTPASGAFTAAEFGPSGSSVTPFAVTVDPVSGNLLIGREASGGTSEMQVAEYSPSGTLLDTHGVGSKISEGTASSAVSGNLAYYPSNGNIYLDFISPTAPKVFILNLAPPPGVHFTEVANLGSTTATFKGTVTPPAEVEGQKYEATWHFEYGTDGIHWTKIPAPDKSAGSVPSVAVPVEETVTGLLPNTAYQVRLCATTGTEVCDPSPPKEFTTLQQAPMIASTWPEEVTQTEATLAAEVNPNNLPTTYHFEWGTEAGVYTHRVPAFERHIGGGSAGIVVQEPISGLQPETEYHFRLVAANSKSPGAGTPGPDQRVETLNSCGLTAKRCFELVSPADKGPVGSAGELATNAATRQFQASSAGSAIAYTMAYGLPNSTTGGELYYWAQRSPSGWLSSQLDPPGLAPSSEWSGATSQVGETKGSSGDLGCSVQSSSAPLTPGSPTVHREGGNLYLLQDGSYTLLTYLPPTNEESTVGAQFELLGLSEDCGKVIFSTVFQYPGIPVVPNGSGVRVYEWDHGTLRNFGVVPGPSGDVSVGSKLGSVLENAWNAVSEDGSRVIFSAARQRNGAVAGAGEKNKTGIFVRENGTTTVDVSESQTATADAGANYQTASKDGRYVFFTANYGLTAPPSVGPTTCAPLTGVGCDLYRYDIQGTAGQKLTDLSADSNPADTQGAGVAGVLDASDDGTYVYFAAKGQLVPNKGNTFAQNSAGSGTYNVYLAHGGSLGFVGLLRSSDLEDPSGPGAIMGKNSNQNSTWASRATPDGKHLLFPSTANVTGYESGGPVEAYLYSAESGATVCISCRRDGQPALPRKSGAGLLATSAQSKTPLAPPVTLDEDGKRAFFITSDRLAHGAIAGEDNLYEWNQGQVSLVASRFDGIYGNSVVTNFRFAGASADGDDLFFVTPQSLVAQDVDGRADVYDARAGGGFPAPAPAPALCEAQVEGSCQGAPSSLPPTGSPPASSTSTDAGNAKPKHHKKKHQKKHHKKKRKHARSTNANRRAGK
jgi:hypothetical protein